MASRQRRAEAAVEVWRRQLAFPVEQLVLTPEQLEQERAEYTAKLEALIAARGELRSIANGGGDPERIKQAQRRVKQAEAAANAGVRFFIQAGKRVTAPSTSEQRAEWGKARQERVERYDEAVRRTRPVLVRLTEHGADPLFILSVLVLFDRRSTEPPRPRKVSFRLHAPSEAGHIGDVVVSLRPKGKWLPGEAGRPRKRGPAEAPATTGMALLAQHLRRATGRPQFGRIADLARVWWPDIRGAGPDIRGGGYLTDRHVRRRVDRIKNSEPFRAELRAFRRLIEAQRMTYTF